MKGGDKQNSKQLMASVICVYLSQRDPIGIINLCESVSKKEG